MYLVCIFFNGYRRIQTDTESASASWYIVVSSAVSVRRRRHYAACTLPARRAAQLQQLRLLSIAHYWSYQI